MPIHHSPERSQEGKSGKRLCINPEDHDGDESFNSVTEPEDKHADLKTWISGIMGDQNALVKSESSSTKIHITSEVGKISEKMVKLSETVHMHGEEIDALKKRNEQLENESRSKNIVICGIPENPSETDDSLRRAVTETIARELGIKQVNIDVAWRWGAPGKHPRRVVVELLYKRDRNAILEKRMKSKPPVFFNKHVSRETAFVEGRLRYLKNEATRKGQTAKVLWDKQQLIINNKHFQLVKGNLVEIGLGVGTPNTTNPSPSPQQIPGNPAPDPQRSQIGNRGEGQDLTPATERMETSE